MVFDCLWVVVDVFEVVVDGCWIFRGGLPFQDGPLTNFISQTASWINTSCYVNEARGLRKEIQSVRKQEFTGVLKYFPPDYL